MKHALFAAALLSLTLTACGQKDVAAAKPESPAVATPVPALVPAPAASGPTASTETPAPATLEASKPAAGGEADLKPR